MYTINISTTAWDGSFKNVHDNLFPYEYHGIDKVPYLNVGFNQVVGHNIIISTIDESAHTVTGALVLHIGDRPTLNGTGCTNWILSVGVHPEYQGRGLSKVLIREFFELCKKHNISGIEQSSYTALGKGRIKDVFEAYAERYPDVGFVDVLNVEEEYCQ